MLFINLDEIKFKFLRMLLQDLFEKHARFEINAYLDPKPDKNFRFTRLINRNVVSRFLLTH